MGYVRKCGPGLRGQLSLEMLLLLAVNLSVFIILLPAILKSRETVELTMAMLNDQKVVTDISSIVDTICILGPGNRQDIDIVLLKPANLSASGKEILLERAESMQTARTDCEVTIEKIEIPAKISIKIALTNAGAGGPIIGNLHYA
jgi:uncharacterized protein (UPF0333 family)